MTIKAIFFDFDDTLGDRVTYATACFRAILEENTDIDDPILMEEAVQDCMMWDESGNIAKSHIEKMLKKKYGIVLPFDNFMDAWVDLQWRYCVPYEDSERTLQELGKRYQLGVITNGPVYAQMQKLKQSGLDRYFPENNVIISGAYPFKKPDPEIFWEACRHLDVKPEEAVHVGDIYSRDISGALRAGLTPVWMTASGRKSGGGNVLKIDKISDLLKYF